MILSDNDSHKDVSKTRAAFEGIQVFKPPPLLCNGYLETKCLVHPGTPRSKKYFNR